jgi:hypothetical protein
LVELEHCLLKAFDFSLEVADFLGHGVQFGRLGGTLCFAAARLDECNSEEFDEKDKEQEEDDWIAGIFESIDGVVDGRQK